MMPNLETVWPDWHIEELIGQGSYGKVYRISRESMGHMSYRAVKLIEIPQDETEIVELASQGMDNFSIRAYLEKTAKNIVNEIAVMESLKGANNVVNIDDYKLVEHEDDIGWTIWIRMELLEPLVDHQGKNGPPDVEEAVHIGKDICTALKICHESGIIHRDVKPENIFRNAFGDYKLGDFGIAKQMEASARATYSQKGTRQYMAPEVARGERYGANADIYSLGMMLYRFLNGMRFPFLPPAPQPFTPNDTQNSLLRRLRGEALPAPRDADPELAKIVLRACEADVSKRYTTAEEMLTDLERWEQRRLNSEPVPSEPLQPVRPPVHPTPPNPPKIDDDLPNIDDGHKKKQQTLFGGSSGGGTHPVQARRQTNGLFQKVVGIFARVVVILAFTFFGAYLGGAQAVPLLLISCVSGAVLLYREHRTVFGVLLGATIALAISALLGITPVLYWSAAVCGGIAVYTAVSK